MLQETAQIKCLKLSCLCCTSFTFCTEATSQS